MRRLTLLVPILALLAGCPQPEPEPEPDPEPEIVVLPDVIPNEWLLGLTGTIENRKEYVSGPLADTECTEIFEVAGANISAIVPEECAQCDVVFEVFLTKIEDCPGGDDLYDEGELGFDLRQAGGEAVLWWFFQGWFGSDWTELGTATLSRDDSELPLDDPTAWTDLTLDMQFLMDDPDNGSWTGNLVLDDPCAWNDPCQFNGFYTMDFNIEYEVDDTWLDEQTTD